MLFSCIYYGLILQRTSLWVGIDHHNVILYYIIVAKLSTM
jgi:hypothetical protein